MRNWVVEFPTHSEKWFATASCILRRAVQRKAQASWARSAWKGRLEGKEGAEERGAMDMGILWGFLVILGDSLVALGVALDRMTDGDWGEV